MQVRAEEMKVKPLSFIERRAARHPTLNIIAESLSAFCLNRLLLSSSKQSIQSINQSRLNLQVKNKSTTVPWFEIQQSHKQTHPELLVCTYSHIDRLMEWIRISHPINQTHQNEHERCCSTILSKHRLYSN